MPLNRAKIKKSRGRVIPAFRYFLMTTWHKWFVFWAGIRIGCPIWRLITHDLSKYGRHEIWAYGRQFFGDASEPEKFAAAWLHHQNSPSNQHHWEYWIPRTKHDQSPKAEKCLDMPEDAIYEMIADWMGATRAYSGIKPTKQKWPWLRDNLGSIRVSEHTMARVIAVLLENDLICPGFAGQFWEKWKDDHENIEPV